MFAQVSAKRADKAATLHARPPQQTPFCKNDGPGDQAEGEQRQQDQLRYRTGVGEHFDDFAADEYCWQGGKMHCI